MTWTANGWIAATLGEWMSLLRTNTQVETGKTTEVIDQRYILARLLLVLGNAFTQADTAWAAAIMALDPTQAFGRAADICAWRLGLRRLAAQQSRMLGFAYGTPGQKLNGQLATHKATATQWILEACEIGPLGSTEVFIRSVAYGPVDTPIGGGVAAWTLDSQVVGWTGLEMISVDRLGRLSEEDGDLLVRIQQAEAALGGTEAAVIAAMLQVPEIGQWRAYFNRGGEVDENGLPGHSIEIVASAGKDVDIAAALRAAASGTAGFYGNTPVELPSLQAGGSPVIVPISRDAPIRVYARVTLKTTGAEVVVLASELARQTAVIVAAWALTLQPGVDPVTSLASEAVVGSLVKGCVVSCVVEFSRDQVTWTDQAIVGPRELAQISNGPSPAILASLFSGPYVISPGWTLVLQVGAGPDQPVVFTGAETTPTDIVDAIAAAGLSGIIAELDGLSWRVRTVATGTAALLTVRPATDIGFCAETAFPFPGASATGQLTDIQVLFI